MIKKVRAIVNDKGHVIGTQISDDADDAARAGVSIVAGPGHTLYEIDFDVPVFKSGADVENFHRQLAASLRK
jgi:hypothetical protein